MEKNERLSNLDSQNCDSEMLDVHNPYSPIYQKQSAQFPSQDNQQVQNNFEPPMDSNVNIDSASIYPIENSNEGIFCKKKEKPLKMKLVF
jgi:hypothetical protein